MNTLAKPLLSQKNAVFHSGVRCEWNVRVVGNGGCKGSDGEDDGSDDGDSNSARVGKVGVKMMAAATVAEKM